MTAARRYVVDVTTAADGSATAYSESITGVLDSIQYVKDGSNAYANGVDFTITTETTAQNLWVQSDVNASAKVAPRQPTHSTAGVAALYAGSGTAVNAPIAIARERVKIVLAAGGDTKTGKFHIVTV